MFEGLKRHWFILREVWRAEGERRKRKKLIDEVDFLPAALEILEKPPSPLGRTLVWRWRRCLPSPSSGQPSARWTWWRRRPGGSFRGSG